MRWGGSARHFISNSCLDALIAQRQKSQGISAGGKLTLTLRSKGFSVFSGKMCGGTSGIRLG